MSIFSNFSSASTSAATSFTSRMSSSNDSLKKPCWTAYLTVTISTRGGKDVFSVRVKDRWGCGELASVGDKLLRLHWRGERDLVRDGGKLLRLGERDGVNERELEAFDASTFHISTS